MEQANNQMARCYVAKDKTSGVSRRGFFGAIAAAAAVAPVAKAAAVAPVAKPAVTATVGEYVREVVINPRYFAPATRWPKPDPIVVTPKIDTRASTYVKKLVDDMLRDNAHKTPQDGVKPPPGWCPLRKKAGGL